MSYIALLNHFGQELVTQLGPLSLELAVWAGFIQLLIWGLRITSPALRHGLWLLVLAKPFSTFLIKSPVSLYGLLPDFSAGQETAASQTAYLVQSISTAGPSAVLAAEDLHGYGVFGLIWLGMAAVLILRLLVGQGRVWSLRRRSHLIADGPLYDLLQEIFADIGLRRPVRVALSDEVPGPLLTGFLRPLILLPRKSEQHFSAAQMKLILAHEVEHVRRGDNLVLLVQRLVETALFFHPVAWLSGRYLRREAEKACDDSVLRRYPNPVEYADSLTRIVEMRGDFQYGLPVHTFARAESQMAQRVRRILGGRATSRRVGTNLVSLLLLLTVGCIGLPRHMVSAEKDQSEGDVKVLMVQAFADSATSAADDTVMVTLVKKMVVSQDGAPSDSLTAAWKKARIARRETLLIGEAALVDSNILVRSYYTTIPDSMSGQFEFVGKLLAHGGMEDRMHARLYDVTAVPDTTTMRRMKMEFESQALSKGDSSTIAVLDTAAVRRMKTELQALDKKITTAVPDTAEIRRKIRRMKMMIELQALSKGDSLTRAHARLFKVKAVPDTLAIRRMKMELQAFSKGDPLNTALLDTILLPELSHGATDSLVMYSQSSRIVFVDERKIDVNALSTENGTPISFNMPSKGDVQLEIYDHKGHRVRTMLDAVMGPGEYKLSWDGLDSSGKPVEDGSYFYKLGIGKKTTQHPIELKSE